jgi:TorA maturation chaperone TorD
MSSTVDTRGRPPQPRGRAPMAAVAAARGALYRFLAATFLAPLGPETLALFESSGLAERIERLFGPLVAGQFAQVARGTAALGALRQEFDNLLVVPLGRYLTPYEAVYTDERVVGNQRVRGLLMGPSTVAVQACYRAAGAQLDGECRELPDHVGVELSFMQFLCDEERRAWEQGDRSSAVEWRARERHFVQHHLGRWVPELCRRMAERAATAFYRGVALLTAEFVAVEVAGLSAEEQAR